MGFKAVPFVQSIPRPCGFLATCKVGSPDWYQDFGCASGRTADPSSSLPRFPVELGGVDKLRAPFSTESRMRGSVSVAR
jgi:hypothetical protein